MSVSAAVPAAGPALLLVAHGSRDPAAGAVHRRLVERVRALAPAVGVSLAYLDHASPSVTAALAGHGEAGQPVVVVPLLLSAAAHAKGDIPGALRVAVERHPGFQVRYAPVLGPHPSLLSLLARRLDEAGVPASAAVVLAAAGSADPDANAEVARTARLLWEWRGGPPVEAAFASATVPTVAEAVARLRLLGYGSVAVASYFLAPGRLPAAVRAAAAGLPVTEPLGDSPEVAALVLERYRAVGDPVGDRARLALTNCDTCQYRSAWPGRESRVGAPVRVHTHPLDV
jgi:sirohydrochlorin cobaltochelatase